MEQNKEGNPNDLPTDAEASSKVFGSSEEFFEQLERDVNGTIDDSFIDQPQESVNEARHESPVAQDPKQVTPEKVQGNSNSIDWEKRYKDSSREAQKLAAKAKQSEKFEPLLQVMRKDEGLVKHIRDYLKQGAKKKSIKEELGVSKDFVYDQNEAVNNPKSTSAKIFDKTVEEAVDKKIKVREKVSIEKQNQEKRKQMLLQKAKEFQGKYNLPQKEFKKILQHSAAKKLSFEDSYLLLNKDTVSKTVASNVRKDVMDQMQNARNIPQSASHSNSAQVEQNPNDAVFDSIIGSDDEVDNLFG